MAKTRDTYFDLLKCVAMFMVVVYHVQSYRPGFIFFRDASSLFEFHHGCKHSAFFKFPKVANVIFGGR